MYRLTRSPLTAAAAAAMMVAAMVAGPAGAGETPAPEGAKVYFISPQDGETLSSPVTIVFGLEGMGIAPAGVEKEKTGHHHLIINAELPDPDFSIPADENHRHFGGGQTQATIELPPGSHSLQLLLGDHNHIPHNPPIFSEKITVTVK